MKKVVPNSLVSIFVLIIKIIYSLKAQHMSTYSKLILSVCFLFVSMVSLQAQNKDKDLEKYLADVVTQVDGKVVFSETIQSNYTQDQIQQLLEQWAEDRKNEEDSHFVGRVLYSDLSKHEMVMQIEDRLVFSSNAFSLDYAMVSYYLIFQIENQNCTVTIKNIRYKYSTEKEIMTAENTITDEVALNKQKTKLNRFYNKFRIATIDMVEDIFDQIDQCLNKDKYDAVADAAKSRRSSNTSAATVAKTPVVEEALPVAVPIAVAVPTVVTNNTTTTPTTTPVQEPIAVVATENKVLLPIESNILALSKEKAFAQTNFFLIGENVAYVRQLSAISATIIDGKQSVVCYANNDGAVLPKGQIMPTSKFKILYYTSNNVSYAKLAELSKKYEKGEAYSDNDITLIQLLLENSKDILVCDHLKIETQPTSAVSSNPTIEGMPSVGKLIKTSNSVVIKGTILK